MSKIIFPGQTIGIIGGGQLGRMMAIAAKEAGFKIAVLEPAMDSPCGQIADIRIVAPYDDEAALEEFRKNNKKAFDLGRMKGYELVWPLPAFPLISGVC